jgi:hypothetical protein
MNKGEVLDLLAVVAVSDRRTVGETDVESWHRMLGRYDKADCLDAIEEFRRLNPGVWLEPGHVSQRVSAQLHDRYERRDPETREWNRELPEGSQRDHYGHVDRSLEGDIEYPADWTSEQRLKSYWDKVASSQSTGFDGVGTTPASADARRYAMEHIRAMLNRSVV